jgi:hypothetical protein
VEISLDATLVESDGRMVGWIGMMDSPSAKHRVQGILTEPTAALHRGDQVSQQL